MVLAGLLEPLAVLGTEVTMVEPSLTMVVATWVTELPTLLAALVARLGVPVLV